VCKFPIIILINLNLSEKVEKVKNKNCQAAAIRKILYFTLETPIGII
jgi:hypothetical protein